MTREYIEREVALRHKRRMQGFGFSQQDEYLADAVLVEDIKNIPAADVVSKGLYEQIKWERDVAIEQLKEYGVSLCEKADVVKVVRCKDCINWDCGDCYRQELARPDDYCSYGVRKED